MKKIVLHALDIENHKNGKETDHDTEMQREKTIKISQGSHEGGVREMGMAKRHQHATELSSSSDRAPVDLETPLPAVTTRVRSKGSAYHPEGHSKHSSVFQLESEHAAATPAPPLVGPKGSAPHPERGNLSSSLSRHSSGFGSMQDEGSNARLEWSEEKLHSSPAALSAHDSEVKPKRKETPHNSPSKKVIEDGSRGSLSTGDGHVSPVHAWVYPASDLHQSVTSRASSRYSTVQLP